MTDLIDLAESKGRVYVWTAEDWLRLRTEYRIIGELIGCLPKLPRQEILQGLPLLLTENEATLLLEKKVVRLVSWESIVSKPSAKLKTMFQEYRDKLFVEQEECLRNARREQLTLVMDKIVEGKRRKILGLSTNKKKMRKDDRGEESRSALEKIDVNRDELLEEEMVKLPRLERDEALVQTHTGYPWTCRGDTVVSQWQGPTTPEAELRRKVYRNLWERGFYITSGENFGGDFLVYPGDPIMFHSQFIVICRDRDEDIPVTELIAQCRVACQVRKTLAIASLSTNGEDVSYQSFQWADSYSL